MQSDDNILRSILYCVEAGTIRADQVVGFLFEGLDNSLKEAEFAYRRGEKDVGVARLRELQALTERVIRISTPDYYKRPRLVSA